MIRYLLLGWLLTALIAFFCYGLADNRAEQINILKGQINEVKQEKAECDEKISKYNTAQARAGEKIEKIRTIVRTVKSDCDCYNIALPDDVRRMLHDK